MNTLQVNENYLKHYHLSHDPFAARVPNFKFFSAQRKTILGQLHHLARHSTLMLVVTGPQDSGKTLLRQALIASVNKGSIKIVNILVADCRSTSDLMGLLVNELQASSKELGDVVAQINKLKEKGVDLYLMIDDADQLTEDVLHTLLNLAEKQLVGLHIFLFARTGLLDRIEKSSLAKEVTFNLPLAPYSLDETADYLTSRLEAAGQKLAIFTEAEVTTIYTKSGGWPGAINQIAKDILLSRLEQNPEPKLSTTSFSADFDEEQKTEPTLFALDDEDFEEEKQVKPKFKLPKKHLIIVAIIAVILILILLFSNSSKTGQKPEVVDNGQAIDLSSNTTTQTVNIPLGGNEQGPVNNNTNNIDTSSNQPQPDMPVQLNTQPNTDSTGKPIATTPPDVPPVTPPVVVESPPSVATPETIKPKKTETQEKIPVVKKKDEPTKTTTTAVVKTAGAEGNAWYRNQNGNNFAIQVSVAGSERLAKDFLKKYAGSYQYFKRSRSGRIDYVITTGNYSSRVAAQNAIKTLPAAVQSSKPWVRSFASIKQELAK